MPAQDPGFFTTVVAKTYPREHILKIFQPSDHETQVASVAAGGSFVGSQATGVAPGARLLYFLPFKGAFLESFLFAERDTRVDLITCSFDLWDSTDGEDVQAHVLDRIIAYYGKPVVKASGNARAAVQSIQGAASASRVITVGTYSSHASEQSPNVYGHDGRQR